MARGGAQVRAAAAQVVDDVVSNGRSLDDALAMREAGFSSDDKRLLAMLCFGCVRHHWHLAEWRSRFLDRPLKKRDSVINALIDVGLFQITDTRVPDHAAVSQTVEAARTLRRPKLAGLVNAVLRRFMRETAAEPESDAARFDHPDWIVKRLQRDWPEDWRDILTANNDRAPMWLRVNAQRRTPSEYIDELAAADIEVAESDGTALRLREARPVAVLPGFDEGYVSVQDRAAQLAAPWLLTSGAGRVLDACAAPGGKSAHLCEIKSDIDLTAIDIDERRLGPLRDNLDRLGLSATVERGDASLPDEWWDREPFDAILLDAPCSASGVIRRHPDIKLLRRDTDIDALAKRQRAMLDALWPSLAAGGRLLYVTCSVFAAENDAVVAAFLKATPDAAENTMLQNNNIRDLMRRKSFGYQVLPGAGGSDGFYFASLDKEKSE